MTLEIDNNDVTLAKKKSRLNATQPIVALYGGTFDPIHNAHLQTVESMAQLADLQKIIILPNHVPPHRPQPLANAQQRLAMVELAIQHNPLFSVDTRELERKTPSYTFETLQNFRQELGSDKPLAFIIGQDSLFSINTWHEWDKLLDVCHLLVCQRPGSKAQFYDLSMQSWLNHHQVDDPTILHQRAHGAIFIADTPLLPISATEIRQRLKQGLDCQDLLPAPVLDYIQKNNLYR